MSFLSPTAGLHRRSVFYGQLATLLRAAIPVSRILSQLVASPPEASLGKVARQLRDHLDHGGTWTEAFRSVPGWAPAFDLALIEAGERSGRLDDAFDTLARHHRIRAENIQKVLQSSAYPLLVLHIAVFVVPLPALVSGGSLAGYLAKSVGVLVVFYALIGLTAWAFAGQRGDLWRAWVERLCLRVPVLGAARSALALSRLARALEALTSAGVLVTEGWPLAARASGSPLLTETVAAWPSRLASGQTPAELVAISGPFPDLFVSAYSTGEISGQLDQQLRWLASHYEEEGFQKLRALAVAFPMIGYALLGIWIIIYIFSMFLGYVNVLDSLLGQ